MTEILTPNHLADGTKEALGKAIDRVWDDGFDAGYRKAFQAACALIQRAASDHRKEGHHQIADTLQQVSINVLCDGDRLAAAAADRRAV